MRVFLIGAACVVSCAGPAFAQGERAYVNVGGGVATSADTTSGDVLGGAGVARLTPAAAFIYSSGTLQGTTPALGDDVTAQLVSLGAFTQPAPTNAFMFTIGGGVQMPTAPRVSVDVGYRLSRIEADTPTNAHGVVVGIGYRF